MAGIGVLLVEPDGDRYLLLKRSEDKDFAAGAWECVTGRVEQGEGFEDAAHREVREELGINVHLHAILGTTHFHRGVERPDNELIGIIYRNRWEIEILFKWIKCNLKCRHLLAESLQGVTIQIYLAIIATLLLFLAVGHRPTKRQMELIHLFSLGWVSLPELSDGLKLSKGA